MATRFHFLASTAPSISPAFDAGWDVTASAVRRSMILKGTASLAEALADQTISIPTTTTQQVLFRQYISQVFHPTNLTGSITMVVRVLETNAGTNGFLAYVLRALSEDGGTVLGTLSSSMTNTGTEYATSAQTRIFAATAITPLVTGMAFRFCLELGVHAQAPTVTNNATMRFGNSAASDFALTSGLTTDLNPWFEITDDFGKFQFSHYQSVKAGSGIWTNERIR